MHRAFVYPRELQYRAPLGISRTSHLANLGTRPVVDDPASVAAYSEFRFHVNSGAMSAAVCGPHGLAGDSGDAGQQAP